MLQWSCSTSAFTSASCVKSALTLKTLPLCDQFLGGGIEPGLIQTCQHDSCAFREKGFSACPPNAAAAPRDDRDTVRKSKIHAVSEVSQGVGQRQCLHSHSFWQSIKQ